MKSCLRLCLASIRLRDILGGIVGDVVHPVVTHIDHQRRLLEEDVVEDGHDVQGHQGGIAQAADDDDGHAAHELARHVVAEHHLQHGQNGGQGGHQDGAHTGLAGGDKGRTALHDRPDAAGWRSPRRRCRC